MKSVSIDILTMAAVGLILVLAMMVIAPMTMAHNDTPVTVPLARTAERKVEENLTISYTVEREILLNDIRYDDLAELERRLEQEILRDPYILVVVRADKEVLHSEVLDILALARRAGALRIACATKRVDEGSS